MSEECIKDIVSLLVVGVMYAIAVRILYIDIKKHDENE